MEELIKKIVKLIDVKSIITIVVTVLFAVLCIRETISSEMFMTVFTMILAFYFGTQSNKR